MDANSPPREEAGLGIFFIFFIFFLIAAEHRGWAEMFGPKMRAF
jgi:hypothetical protein